MWSSDLFFCIQLFPTFFTVQVFQSPDFSGSRFSRVQVFQGPGFSESRFFWVQVFQGPGFSGSRFFWVQVFQGPGPGFSSSPSQQAKILFFFEVIANILKYRNTFIQKINLCSIRLIKYFSMTS